MSCGDVFMTRPHQVLRQRSPHNEIMRIPSIIQAYAKGQRSAFGQNLSMVVGLLFSPFPILNLIGYV